MKISQLEEYELIEEREIKDLESAGFLLRHRKTGARVLVLSNEDENKVFTIGFRTPPEDSTGTPHIIEHSVLCGSKRFPSKDPFVELVKGSLNTFLNAMTYPDKTLYPVASTNDKDFLNLMHVYMDAVFYPNIYENEKIFKQEGWHYELEAEDDPIKYNGVVYNEMKGAFSSPEDVLQREILNSLFPDTCYAHESGGNPEDIPGLTYQAFLDFHRKYYHPSNSYIYLYGNMDAVERLQWLDREYLSKYDYAETDSDIKVQKGFEKPVEIKKQYSITSTEPEEDNTYLAYNAVIGTSLDKELYMAFQILEYALISAPGAPLKKALLDAKIGKDIMGSYDNGTIQPVFSVIAKNSNIRSKEQFVEIIKNVLEGIVEKGIDKKALKAGINYFEFKYREADFGAYPKGLMYGLQAFDSWLYDDLEPFMHIEAIDTFKLMKEKAESAYFEKLIQTYVLDNTHASLVIIEPERGLTARNEKALEETLKQYKDSLAADEIQKLIEQTEELVIYQETPSTEAELETIPMLEIEDIKREAAPLYNKEVKFGDTLVLHHCLHTNQIGYLELLFDTKAVPKELIPYMGILKFVLCYVDTENYDYGELFNEININTGGISAGLSLFSNVKENEKYTAMFEVRAKVLYENLDFAFRMIDEILFTSKLDDSKRLYEIIARLKSRMQMSMVSSGHSTASMRALSYFSPSAYFSEITSGISFYRLVESIESDFERVKEELVSKLKELMKYIFRSENLVVSYTADEEGFAGLEKEIEQLKMKLFTDKIETQPYKFELKKQNEGFKTSSKIQYVARSGNFINSGYKYTGALKILKLILSYDYLWNNVRVKGGAYGCMSGFSKLGDSYFASYRDPNMEKTNQIFENTADYIRKFDASDRDMLKYIIGTISDIDTPMNPSAKGSRSLSAYFNKISFDDLQKERDEILSADAASIRGLADLVESVIRQNNLCVIGNEDNIENGKEMFLNVENLFLSKVE
ncbi:insulinase family protein [Anaerobium acetethylicum]|uniref:Peptidase M16C associated domain-containing protein n=1 Tax=Anaerobium acetethylicum TaxID=1619234 RepID=A0A1D3TS75_9FIRM|nr:insulinase family protein [Anaerobium acetethylicum]SCP96670.1 hypothetical protein SAMN05421730_1005161 [Anaerobium acetethylicum]